ncbi:serine hydrolase domain-containing protein [Spirillospora sp. CA-294931]|uniref:serine hydrolase domain-containing protein n=1 Tax=Spirillospora sp. CA-294931 TaxID=3240042 RepID=UPI003D8B263A
MVTRRVAAALLVALVWPVPATASAPLDAGMLQATLDATRMAGVPGLYSQVREGDATWSGASGFADVRTRAHARPDMEHRVGAVTQTFVATAVMRQVDRGRVDLDAPVDTYLPDEIPGQRGKSITVRMLLGHTSGIGDYLNSAFPSLADRSPRSLDEGRHRGLRPSQLIRWGADATSTGTPGERWSYSNTNYVLAGRVLEKVTGESVGAALARDVLRPAGLTHTYFPSKPRLRGPHSRMYESLFQGTGTPRDYSAYDMSWAGSAGALVSTMDDLNRFTRALFTGRLVSRAALVEMSRGLGLTTFSLPCGTFWGYDGDVFGAGTRVLSSPDGHRQLAVGVNLTRYQRLSGEGLPLPHPIDNALRVHISQALCGGPAPAPASPLPIIPAHSPQAHPSGS